VTITVTNENIYSRRISCIQTKKLQRSPVILWPTLTMCDASPRRKGMGWEGGHSSATIMMPDCEALRGHRQVGGQHFQLSFIRRNTHSIADSCQPGDHPHPVGVIVLHARLQVSIHTPGGSANTSTSSGWPHYGEQGCSAVQLITTPTYPARNAPERPFPRTWIATSPSRVG